MGMFRDGYYYLDNEEVPKYMPKITGTRYPALAGLDKFTKRGDQVLKDFKAIVEPFDEFYTKRGAIGETLARRSLERDGHICTIYKGTRDCFKGVKGYGGVIDIELINENTLYEIKTKNIKDYEKIIKYGSKEQEAQARHYGWLRGYHIVYIQWIFFPDNIEEWIKNGQPITSWSGIKTYIKKLYVNLEEEEKAHWNALQYYTKCYNEKRIPIEDISSEYQKKLGIECEVLTPENNPFKEGI